MTREEAKELLPIIQAFAEGKVVQYRNNSNEWLDIGKNASVGFTRLPLDYRIKPEPKCRPFKNQEECWNEMHKHPDFGWVAAQDSKVIYHINIVGDGYIHIDGSSVVFSTAYSEYEFLDGTPFGVMEE